jgi:hypothetical protein
MTAPKLIESAWRGKRKNGPDPRKKSIGTREIGIIELKDDRIGRSTLFIN